MFAGGAMLESIYVAIAVNAAALNASEAGSFSTLEERTTDAVET